MSWETFSLSNFFFFHSFFIAPFSSVSFLSDAKSHTHICCLPPSLTLPISTICCCGQGLLLIRRVEGPLRVRHSGYSLSSFGSFSPFDFGFHRSNWVRLGFTFLSSHYPNPIIAPMWRSAHCSISLVMQFRF